VSSLEYLFPKLLSTSFSSLMSYLSILSPKTGAAVNSRGTDAHPNQDEPAVGCSNMSLRPPPESRDAPTTKQFENGRNAKAERSLSNDHLDCLTMSDPGPTSISQHLNITSCDDEFYQEVIYEEPQSLNDLSPSPTDIYPSGPHSRVF